MRPSQLLLSLITLISFGISASMLKAESEASGISLAQPLAQDSAVTVLADKISQLRTFKAHFEQKVMNENGKLLDTSLGEFYIQKPNHFRWHIKQQFEQLIVADGDHIFTYDPDLEQVTIQNQSKLLADSPLLFLTSNAIQLANAFDIQLSQTADDKMLFQLKPKGQGGVFESVMILFNGQQMQELLLRDSLAQTTSITFTQVELNQKLALSLFSFVMPEGVDIIDSRTDIKGQSL
jgi:outer membrane lipoprotein carrier protein